MDAQSRPLLKAFWAMVAPELSLLGVDQFVTLVTLMALALLPTNFTRFRFSSPQQFLEINSLRDARLVMNSQVHDVQGHPACRALHQRDHVVVRLVHVPHQGLDGWSDVSARRTLELSSEVLLPPVIAEYSPEFKPPVAIRTDELSPLLVKVPLRFVILLLLLCDFILAAILNFLWATSASFCIFAEAWMCG